jgi:SAM-dependent methyltransferase
MLGIERIVKITPDILKPLLGKIYRVFKGFYLDIKKRNVDAKSLDEILNYWKNPQDGHNLPTNYLNNANAHIRSQNLLKVLEKYAGRDARILEPGCNVGRNLNYLFESGFINLEGIELNKDALELLKKAYPKMAQHITIHNQAIEEIITNFKDNTFDVIYTMAVLQHIHPASEWVFSEIVRITKSYLITMEGEDYVSWRHFPRNYKKIFESLGMKQVEINNSFRVFKKM